MSVLTPVNIVVAIFFYSIFISSVRRKKSELLYLFLALFNTYAALNSIFNYFNLFG